MAKAAKTRIERQAEAVLVEHPDQTGVHLLPDGRDAFVARGVLARLAEKSIDVQYSIYSQDTAGQLLTDQLLRAADRGVRVRLLIDDRYGDKREDIWTARYGNRTLLPPR